MYNVIFFSLTYALTFFEQQGSFTINLDYLEQAKPREDFFFDLLSPGKKKLLCHPGDVPLSRLLSSFTIAALPSYQHAPSKPALLGIAEPQAFHSCGLGAGGSCSL